MVDAPKPGFILHEEDKIRPGRIEEQAGPAGARRLVGQPAEHRGRGAQVNDQVRCSQGFVERRRLRTRRQNIGDDHAVHRGLAQYAVQLHLKGLGLGGPDRPIALAMTDGVVWQHRVAIDERPPAERLPDRHTCEVGSDRAGADRDDLAVVGNPARHGCGGPSVHAVNNPPGNQVDTAQVGRTLGNPNSGDRAVREEDAQSLADLEDRLHRGEGANLKAGGGRVLTRRLGHEQDQQEL